MSKPVWFDEAASVVRREHAFPLATDEMVIDLVEQAQDLTAAFRGYCDPDYLPTVTIELILSVMRHEMIRVPERPLRSWTEGPRGANTRRHPRR